LFDNFNKLRFNQAGLIPWVTEGVKLDINGSRTGTKACFSFFQLIQLQMRNWKSDFKDIKRPFTTSEVRETLISRIKVKIFKSR
jgi:hypothetical protein